MGRREEGRRGRGGRVSRDFGLGLVFGVLLTTLGGLYWKAGSAPASETAVFVSKVPGGLMRLFSKAGLTLTDEGAVFDPSGKEVSLEDLDLRRSGGAKRAPAPKAAKSAEPTPAEVLEKVRGAESATAPAKP